MTTTTTIGSPSNPIIDGLTVNPTIPGTGSGNLTYNSFFGFFGKVDIWDTSATTPLDFYISGSSTGDQANALAVGNHWGLGTINPVVFNAEQQLIIRSHVLGHLEEFTADLRFNEVSSPANADITFINESGGTFFGTGVEGRAQFPGTGTPTPSGATSNVVTNAVVAQFIASAETGGGSYANWIVSHEIGHALSLTHTDWTFDLLIGSLDATGDSVLDNEKYTVMSYEPATASYGLGTQFSFGHSVGFMALDIAALQYYYGIGSNNVTDTTYNLTTGFSANLDIDGSDGAESIGRAYRTIWDYDTTNILDDGNAGTDTISYTGFTGGAWINLNDATLDVSDAGDAEYLLLQADIIGSSAWATLNPILQNEIDASQNNPLLASGAYHAGGFFSYLFDSTGLILDGGYSIANGVIIENAVGGFGNDFLIGNEFSNLLMGNNGGDFLFGGSGADILMGGAGNDTLAGGAGDDTLSGSDPTAFLGGKFETDTFVFKTGYGNDVITDFYANSAFHDFIDFDVDGYSTAQDLINAASQVGKDVVFSFDTNGDGTIDDTLTLLNVKLQHIDASDFI